MLAFSKFVEWLFENHSMLSCNKFLLFDVLSFWPACFFLSWGVFAMNSPSILHSLKDSFETVLLFHSVCSCLLMHCGPDLLVFFLYTESLQWICFHKSLRMKWQLCRKHCYNTCNMPVWLCMTDICVITKKTSQSCSFVTCRFVAFFYEALLIQ